MSNSQDNLFGKVQEQSNINTNDIYKVANSVKNADFSDEQTVRELVQHLAQMADKPISKAKEDRIVETITNNNMPVDMQTLNKMFKK
ncbi:stage VI sporulation protein F [Lentibacillus cibarius]|uniref:Stage VI sporulation protein F n=1 Tax=Lentibacillus cibarius TaxID=2583219 RepID=A0A5S3QG39_9BACI|nr:stage VI sporulation protein F [Lentibacillus cibarius]TMN20689.1 stage VI sporulation protein F [Lentibacillus cibarius]